jgi:hypothetical protein
MNSIWRKDQGKWQLLAPSGFEDEDALHTLIEEAPQLLPLAGAPNLAIVGREIGLGTGFADLVAVEQSGRLVVIEVKLSKNAEARRAIVAQILTYAAYLHGLSLSDLEQKLGSYLRKHNYTSVVDAVAANDQAGSVDTTILTGGINESLSQGRFRLVLVLDSAPDELIQLVGYLGLVASELLIDLVTVSSYLVDGSQILVPQRVEPEQARIETATISTRTNTTGGVLTPGIEEFRKAIPTAPVDQRPILERLCNWAVSLADEGLVYLQTNRGTSQRWTLLLRLRGTKSGLATIWNENGAFLTLHRTVFERSAPKSLAHVEAILAPERLGQGTTTRRVTEEMLSALTDAYREAAAVSLAMS